MAVIKPRSSLAREGYIIHETPIDADYSGQCHAQITNTRSKTYYVKAGERIGQLVIQPVIIADFVKEGDLTLRGNNGLGSTGK